MSKKDKRQGKLKHGTRTDRYGQKPSLPVLPWEDDQDEQKSEEEDEK